MAWHKPSCALLIRDHHGRPPCDCGGDSESEMPNLLAFLRARLDDLERDNGSRNEPESWCDRGNGIHFHHEFIVALVASQRLLIDEIIGFLVLEDGEWGCSHEANEITAGKCRRNIVNEICGLQMLAWPFRKHPDYRQEWKPENV